ncbi:helix-hairpin-helix domain-containing protein [Succinimonas amylolytica]|uniref:helix-hairpin-helix domain-containing protein n=1 Tax=Succinimonas amylolytica TaxID=83769 RepID=UPI00039C459F|nr:serine/threonine-protein kinase [Succinimonas amylolytica]
MSDTKIVRLTALDGSSIEFDSSEAIGSGAMKDVYFSPDKSYVVGFFRKEQDNNSRERLERIINTYAKQLFEKEGGENLRKLFCWPTHIVEWQHKGITKLGVVAPTYRSNFFFSSGRFKGKEKEGKWFASPKLRNKILDDDQKGTWLNYLQVCIKISRAVKRMHAAGLAHSDLSYKNVLVDPLKGDACLIDIDGLVVPGKFPPDVVGTPDFIAPEVLETVALAKTDPSKKVPSILTDRHALAVLIYMYLLYRHPLRGGMICDPDDSARDEELCMGREALFIEHPTNRKNRPVVKNLEKFELPQGDVDKLPYTLCGPYLKPLFDKAFIDGLHDPSKRPSADDWEKALIKTVDLIQPCQNPQCKEKWFVFDNTTKPVCPFCGTAYKGELPILNFYYRPRPNDSFRFENARLMVFSKQSLYKWHIDKNIHPNEKLTDADKKPVGDFHLHHGSWILINRCMDDLYDVSDASNKKQIPIGQSVPLTEGRKILFGTSVSSRLCVVQIVKN